MAERPDRTVSLVEEPTDQNVIYTYRKILPWLMYVDDQIYSSSLPILRLGLMKEINEVQQESSKSASDLYRHLREHYDCVHDDEKALRRFLYALNKLGKERYGRRCIRNFQPKMDLPLPGPKQDLPMPEYYDDTEEDDYFRFLQCLMEMCVQLDKDGRVTSQKDLCSWQHLDIAWQGIDCTADLFTRMLKRTLVTATDNGVLARALGRVHAENCLAILNEFRKITKTGQIDIEEYLRLESLSTSSSPNSSLELTICTDTDNKRSRESTREPEVKVKKRDGTKKNGNGKLRLESLSTRSSTNSSQGCNNRKWSWSGVVGCVFSVIVAEMVLFMISATFLSLALFSESKSPKNDIVLLYENTTAVLGDFQTFSTQKVTIEQDPAYSMNLHLMQIYLYDQSCSRLPLYHKSMPNLTSYSLPKEVNLYLLKGSSLTYNICAITNSTEVVKKHIDLYIFDDLDEVMNFDPNEDEHHGFEKHEAIHLAFTHNLSNHHNLDSAWKCTPISFNVRKDGYYSIIVFLPPGKDTNVSDILVWHEAVHLYKMIDTNSGQLSVKCPGSQVHDSTQPCSIPVPSNRHLPLEYRCLVAGIGSLYSPPVSKSYNEDSDRQQFTQVTITEVPWKAGFIVFYSIAFVSLFLFTAVLLIAIFHCKKHSLLTRSHAGYVPI